MIYSVPTLIFQEEPMGKTAPTPQQRSALEEIKEKFNFWRNAKSGKRRIPDHLWQATVTLFLAHHTINTVIEIHLDQRIFSRQEYV